MVRTKTNFNGILLVEERWLKDSEIKPFMIAPETVKFIESVLELEGRDKLSLQDLRDFAVCYLTTKCSDVGYERYTKLWDCMSAITYVIDSWLYKHN